MYMFKTEEGQIRPLLLHKEQKLKLLMYLEAVQPVAIMREPYLSIFPEFVVKVCFSILTLVTESS